MFVIVIEPNVTGCLMCSALLYRVRGEERSSVFEAEQEQRDDGSQMQADDNQAADHPEHRYTHTRNGNEMERLVRIKQLKSK